MHNCHYNSKRKIYKGIRLTLIFAAMVFFIMFLTMMFVFLIACLLWQAGVIKSFSTPGLSFMLPLFLFATTSLVLGTIMAIVFSRRPLEPLRKIIGATDRIAEGDYSARINLNGPEEFRQLSKSFNHMAEELGSVEMLRSDFVNNFSHEFKTPIVSISGFAKMLKRGDLTETERNEYLDTIISESGRLAELSTNVLNLSKIEQQSILTDCSQFDLSEQIRLVISILDSKWAAKPINFSFDCGEVYITANAEMLKQVWINLIDNAMKFCPENGNIGINIKSSRNIQDNEDVRANDTGAVGGLLNLIKKNTETVIPTDNIEVTISNDGEAIDSEASEHIFDKFYQADTSHATKGNGLGLTIAKKIVELHNGSIELLPDKKYTTFRVVLPQTSIS